ncbi:hypothetical protein [Variovorax sp. 160MFSha2.1]|uniref:hypothetical protein n=1 Tax=Variovorax sp. 160MFSha2.1 TaxID=3158367 RepID=UPI003AB0E5D0
MDPQFQRHLDQMVRNAQRQADQDLFILFIIGVVSTAITIWALYWIIRFAVRDGMRDAQEGRRSTRPPNRHPARAEHIPDMRAD